MAILKSVFTGISLFAFKVFGQRPTEIQLMDEPFDFKDPIKVIFIFTIPLLLLIVGAVWIRKKRNSKKTSKP